MKADLIELQETYSRPVGVPSALTEDEAQTLHHLAQNKLVLELGSDTGFSTIIMAKVATKVHAVDYLQPQEWSSPSFRLRAFTLIDNLERHDVMSKICLYVGKFEEVLHLFKGGYFDMVFIDGHHEKSYVLHDTREALRLVKMGGIIAWHDYGRFGVKAALDELSIQPDQLIHTLAFKTL